jgi:type IV pilus assembly protein PilE
MLSDAAARAERFYAQNNTYLGITLKTIGLASDSKVVALNSPNSKYQLSVAAATATTYQFQVAPQGSQTSDTCGTLTIDQAGNKTPVTAECWR